MKITLGNSTQINHAPLDFVDAVKTDLTLDNPAYLDAVKMGRWTGNIDPYLRCYSDGPGQLFVPRGYTALLIYHAKQAGLRFSIDDRTRTLPPVKFTFTGTLKPFQHEAVSSILGRDTGVLQAPTGSGKTVMALAAIAERRQSTLIIVHTKELLDQWHDRIETFLGIPRRDIGVIGSGKKVIGKKVTVGIVNSVYSIAGGIKHNFGHVVVDECHRCPSRTFTEAVTAFDAKYLLGLSATPYRRDGLTNLIAWHLGPPVKVETSALSEKDLVFDLKVIARETGITPYCNGSQEYSTMLSELTEHPSRNRMIAGDVLKEANNGGGICLVLTDRKSQCDELCKVLRTKGLNATILTGATPKTHRERIVHDLNEGRVKVLIATGQLIGEGFDCRSLQTLFLATPVKFSGRLTQYLGRILRPSAGKDHATVYDYIDDDPVLRASAHSRKKVYDAWQGSRAG